MIVRRNFSRKLSSVCCCCFDAVLQLVNTFRSCSFWIHVTLEFNNFNLLFCHLLGHSWPADCPLVFLLLGKYSKFEGSSLQKYVVCSIYFLTGMAKLSACYFTEQWGWLETWNLSTWATGLRLVVVIFHRQRFLLFECQRDLICITLSWTTFSQTTIRF